MWFLLKLLKNEILNRLPFANSVAVQECQTRKIILKENRFTSLSYKRKEKESWYFHQQDETLLNVRTETLLET